MATIVNDNSNNNKNGSNAVEQTPSSSLTTTTTMTTKSTKEHILMLHSFAFKGVPGMPDPDQLFDPIRSQFPGEVEITLFQTDEGRGEHRKPVPDELWAKATIVVTLFDLPEKIEQVPNLRLIHLISAGSDHLASNRFVNDPSSSHIIITTSSGIHGAPIAEWVLMSTLVLTKHYNVTHDWQKEGKWGDKGLWFTTSGDWVGKTVGILGYGSIGRQVARVFNALGANVHAYTHSSRDTPESKRDNGYIIPNTGDPDGTIPSKWFSSQKDTLEKFLSSGLHVVVISTPLTKETTNLLSAKEFKILQSTSPYPSTIPVSPPPPPSSSSSLSETNNQPNNGNAPTDTTKTKTSPGAIIVNISRGKIINQTDLISALKTKTIKAAALDVTDPEPLPADSELWHLDNVVITPHISGLGKEYLDRSLDVLRVNLVRLLHHGGTKKDLVNVVHRGRGY